MSSMWICTFIFPLLVPHSVIPAFVHDQNPNSNIVANAPVWLAYGASGGQHIVFQGFGNGSFVEKDDFREAGIEFINEQTALVAKMV